MKYSPTGAAIDVRVAPGEADGEWLEVAVTDHGGGMTPETQEKAFDQFFRSDEARRMAPDGSGIGLYAARGLIEAMGGTIGVESVERAGTTVRVRLPAEAVEGA